MRPRGLWWASVVLAVTMLVVLAWPKPAPHVSTRHQAVLDGPCEHILVTCGDRRGLKTKEEMLMCQEIIVQCQPTLD